MNNIFEVVEGTIKNLRGGGSATQRQHRQHEIDSLKNGQQSLSRQARVTSMAMERSTARHWYDRNSEKSFLSTEIYYLLKRALDIAVCLALLPFFVPILGICFVFIKLDSSGPVFFYQRRTGKGGKRFKMYKLRTMIRNAEELKAKYMHLNELTYPDFKISRDPRITRTGRFLRKASLDELPQIFNVLRGNMSLVGPRPTSFSAKTYSLWHTARLEAKPGVTGLWQVMGRHELDFDERLRLDIAYIRNQCFWLDVKILVRTLTSVLSGKGAA